MQHLRAPPSMGERRVLRPAAAAAAAAMAALKCPRCESANTKFCYYNNYNLSQPRHFCKSCRRYWTNGGVLRNVPVGGGCRKPKRPRSSSSSASSSPAPAKPTSDPSSSSSAVPINPESVPPAGGFAFAGDSSYLGSSVLALSQLEKKVVDTGDGDDGVAVEAASLPVELAGVEWPAADGGDQGMMEFSGTIEQSYNWGCQSLLQTQTQIQWCEMDQISSFYFP